MGIHFEERLGNWTVIAAIALGLHLVLKHLSAGAGFVFPITQLEVAGIGVLISIHAKWRRSLKAS